MGELYGFGVAQLSHSGCAFHAGSLLVAWSSCVREGLIVGYLHATYHVNRMITLTEK